VALTPVFITAIRCPQWLPFRPLNSRPIAFVGTLSYTLYLTHQIVIMALYAHAPQMNTFARTIAAFVASFAVAWALYVLVERPSARLRKRLALRVPAAPAMAVS